MLHAFQRAVRIRAAKKDLDAQAHRKRQGDSVPKSLTSPDSKTSDI
jgi:hypothetical protein